MARNSRPARTVIFWFSLWVESRVDLDDMRGFER
jgi:hypothetical protein